MWIAWFLVAMHKDLRVDFNLSRLNSDCTDYRMADFEGRQVKLMRLGLLLSKMLSMQNAEYCLFCWVVSHILQ